MKKMFAIFVLFTFFLEAKEISRDNLNGFSKEATQQQKIIEDRFLSIPTAESVQKYHRFFTSVPHPAGSKRNNDLAKYIADTWKEQGLEDVQLHQYDVLVSYPKEDIVVEMVHPKKYRAGMREDAYEVDPDTSHPDVRGGYLGMSESGEVTAPLVYAHSGNPEDYELLRSKGIDVKGKIVIVRYSVPYSYRGFKALTAEKEGAAAILIYSDPAEDGYVKGKVFPDGPWGPESHIQRGAITYDFMVPGDPLTPGWASLPGAKHISKEQAVSLPKIIAVPLSWRDAKPLLENMDGPEAPKEWQGGLPITYRLGGTEPQVHLKVQMDTSVKPNYVVEGRIRGSEYPDEWIVMGNHRDGWEFGAVDPSSGTASMMELSRSLGTLLKQGVRPKRTLIFCSWDGEEVALTGSTEWGEHFARDLKEKAVAYINVDSSTSGPNFSGNAVASLATILIDATRGLKSPSGETLYEEWKLAKQRDAKEEKEKPISDAELVNTRIGSGTDHTVFLNHLGIPVFDLSFDGPYGVYHSVYDNYYWMNHFGDPGYRYHLLMTQLWGVLAMRLANAELLPFDFAFYGDQIQAFVNDLPDEPAFEKDAARLVELAREFGDAGRTFQQVRTEELSKGILDPEVARKVNRAIRNVERNWLHVDGIPGRPWFKHMLYAARYTYAHLELPAITEAIERNDPETASEQAALLETALAQNTKLLQQAQQLLTSSKRDANTE